MASEGGLHVVVVGAGAFGGWTALELRRRGAAVTLVDAWGPGHPRASSGGDTRVIRASYGSRPNYTRMAARALIRWRECEAAWPGLFRETGVLWMLSGHEAFGRASADALAGEGLRMEDVPLADARRRYPQIDFSGVDRVLFEPAAGYLRARDACVRVVDALLDAGGTYLTAAVRTPFEIDTARPPTVRLVDGTAIPADVIVLACGPWLDTLLPGVVGALMAPTRQEVYYFGTQAGDDRFSHDRLPVWLDLGERPIYGIPGTAARGFKFADDSPGPPIDPTTGDRAPSAAGVAAAGAFLARRFPALQGAPLVAAEVCQYESTPDGDFILDRHPEADHVWIAGGGSGHGFKMGPIVGEMLAEAILDDRAIDSAFALARFGAAPPGGWPARWA